MTVKQYAERDAMALDEAGSYYIRHVMAMTSEGLHSKGDIAAELGWRDMQIDALQQQVNALAAEGAIMLRLLTDISEQYEEVQTEGEENAAVIDLDYISEINSHVSRDVDAENPFVATDAAIREFQAQGIDKWIESRGGYWNGTTMQAQHFAATLLNGEQGGDHD